MIDLISNLSVEAMVEHIALGLLLLYIIYWIARGFIGKDYSEVFLGLGTGILSIQIFLVASYTIQLFQTALSNNVIPPLQVAGLCLIILSIFFITGAFLSKRRMSSLVSFWGDTQVFMAQGVFGIVRHPIQLGGIMVALGISLMVVNIAVIALGLIACVSFIASSREADERDREMIGFDYEVYTTNVPPFNFIKGVVKVFKNR